MNDRTLAFQDNGIYHVYNRATGNEKLFIDDLCYRHFLDGIEKYLLKHVDVWSYCLMPNHFHLLIEIKDNGRMVSKAISDCCNRYAKWLNLRSRRKGNLFMRPFKRDRILNDAHLAWIIWYIHRNPVHHQYVASIDEWKYSSFKAVLSDKSKIASEKVISFFGNADAYLSFHRTQLDGYFSTLE